MIQGLVSEPNFLLAGISHHHAVSFKSDEEHCPCSLALTRFTGCFSRELSGQHTPQLPTRTQTERKPKRFLSLCLQPTSDPGLPGSPGLAPAQTPLQPSQQGLAGRMLSPGDPRCSGGPRCPGTTADAGMRNKRGSGTRSQASWVQTSTCPLPSACPWPGPSTAGPPSPL